MDTPPHEIDPPDSEDDWNDRYLGERMHEEPSLAFERRASRIRGDDPLTFIRPEFNSECAIQVVTSEAQEDELLDIDGGTHHWSTIPNPSSWSSTLGTRAARSHIAGDASRRTKPGCISTGTTRSLGC